ncbi:MAG: hypothetical protein GY753_19960, partial [Gammaproteobacteria bacterium]|nr:hypothetical protein [Gammaproteobacteria bacterium]
GSGATLTGSNLVVEGSRSNQLGYGFKSDTRNPSLTMNLYNCVVTDCDTTAGDFIGFGAAGSNGNVRGNFYQCLVVGLSASGTAYGFRNANTNANSLLTATNCVSYGTDVDYGTPVSGTSTFTNCGSEDGTGAWSNLVPSSELTAYATPIQDVTLRSNAGSSLLGIQNAPNGSSDNPLTLDINNKNRRTTSSSGDPFKWSLGPWDALANSGGGHSAAGAGSVSLDGAGDAEYSISFSGEWLSASSSAATAFVEAPVIAVSGTGFVELEGYGTAKLRVESSGVGSLKLSGSGLATTFDPVCGPYNDLQGVDYNGPGGDEYSPPCDAPWSASGTGSVELSGAGSCRRIADATGVGSVELEGAGTPGSSATHLATGDGNIQLTSSADLTLYIAALGVGSVQLQGSANAVSTETLGASGTGAVSLSGTGVVLRQVPVSGTGSVGLSGLAAAFKTLDAAGSGAAELEGIGSPSVAGNHFPSGAGSVQLSGLGGLYASRRALGEGDIQLSGTGTSIRVRMAAGTGSLQLTGLGSLNAQRPSMCYSGTFLIDAESGADVQHIGIHTVAGEGNILLDGYGLITHRADKVVSGAGGIQLNGQGIVHRDLNIMGIGSVSLGGQGTPQLVGLHAASGVGSVNLRGQGQTTKANFIPPAGCRLILVDAETRSFDVCKPQRQFNVDCLC